MKILVADDHADNRYFLEQLLGAAGHAVISVRNGREALDRLQAEPVDVIVADVLMPGVDGFQLCREVKQNPDWRRLPFIFYTATYTDPKDAQLALSLGADRFLVKPTEPEVFLSTLQDVLDHTPAEPGISPPETGDGTVFLQEYNQRLIQKLEDKLEQLDQANARLRTMNEEWQRAATQRGEAEEAWQRSEFELRLALQMAGMGTFQVHFRTNSLGWSPETFRLFGFQPGAFEPTRARFFELLSAEDAQRIRTAMQLAREGRAPYDLEYCVRWPDGSPHHHHVRGDVEWDQSGEAIRLLGVVRDITTEKEAREARARLEEELHQARKLEALGTLAGGIAHDFNNLITVILGNAELIQLALPAPADTPAVAPAFREGLDQIVTTSHRAGELVRQILTFSRRQKPDRRAIELAPVITGGLRIVRAVVPPQIEMVTQVDAVPGVVFADATAVHQILLNLCTNAAQAMQQGGGRIAIRLEPLTVMESVPRTVGCTNPGGYLRLTVRDNGTGMSPATTARIFEPFFTTKPPGHGVGLGLAVVVGIVQAHDAAIDVESTPGRGTTVRVYFPVIDAEATPDEPLPGEMPRGRSQHVLLVDDEPGFISLARRLLDRLGYRTTGFTEAEMARAYFQENAASIDVVVTDAALPLASGHDLARDLWRIRPGIPIVLTTGGASHFDADSARAQGFQGYLEKPFRLGILATTLDRVLRAGDHEGD